MAKRTREPGRFVTLKSGRVIFIPHGRRSKWADVRDEILAGKRKGRPLTRLTRTIADTDELHSVLKKLSIEHGGAWVFSIRPFSHETKFIRYKNPSSVPDEYIDHSHGKMAHKGRIRGFSEAAKIREGKRGLRRY